MKTQPSAKPRSAVPPGAGPATVFVVDDDPAVLRSLARLLRVSGFQVVTHPSAAEFLAEVHPGIRGCVITDLMMPEMDGMALQEALRNAGCHLPLLFLTGHGDIPTSVKAIRSGAEDFLTKQASKEELLVAVNRALARDEADRASQARLAALREPFRRLTDREREVLRHVVDGRLNKQIAGELGIHERTVKLHRTSIKNKLQVHSVAELTRLVQQAQIL